MTQKKLGQLQFSNATPQLPYAVLAASSMLHPTSLLVLSRSPIGLMSLSVDSTVLKGEPSILRYLARSACAGPLCSLPVYPESACPHVCARIDDWLVAVERCEVKDAEKLADKVNIAVEKSNWIVGSDVLTLADLSVWSFFKSIDGNFSFGGHFKEWLVRMDAVPECRKAISMVKEAPSGTSPSAISSVSETKTKDPARPKKPFTKTTDLDKLIKSSSNPSEIFKLEVANMISKEVNIPAAAIMKCLEAPRGAAAELADYSLPIPKLKMQGNPAKLASDLAEKLQPTDLIEFITSNGPFLNFKVKQSKIRDVVLPIIHAQNVKYGTFDVGKGKNVVVEFSSPNIAKPFHAGHLRSTIIGNFIRNIYKAHGYNTIAMNYLGDWGKQYGLLAVGYSKYGNEEELVKDPIKHLFEVYVKISSEKENDKSVDEFAFAYFKRMEEGDKEALALWQRFRDLSIVKYTDIYSRLNISFDVYSGESKYTEKMKPALQTLVDKHVATDSVVIHKGMLIIGFEKYGNEAKLKEDPIGHVLDILNRMHIEKQTDSTLLQKSAEMAKKLETDKEMQVQFKIFESVPGISLGKPADNTGRLNMSQDTSKYQHLIDSLKSMELVELMVDLSKSKISPARIQRADGTTLYLTRDIAAAIDRHDTFNSEALIYVVGSAQDLHMQQLIKILEMAGFEWSKSINHVNFGMVKGMSTRKGNVVFLEDILNEAKSSMHDVMKQNENKYAQIEDPEKVADIVGISAVMIQDMTSRRIKDYEFDWKRMLSFEGDTGPYLQYAHARLCSIERKYLDSIGLEDDIKNVPPLPFDPKVMVHLDNEKAYELMFAIAQYPDLVYSIPARQFESSVLCTFLFSLCHKVSTCIEEMYVMGQEKEVAEARFWMYWSAKTTLGNGMKLLGLRPLERM